MVVQCTSCRARFRVADEKVPERGVKVRCTKCGTVFKVTKADAVDGKTGSTPRDPFGLDTGRTTPSPSAEPSAPQRRTPSPEVKLEATNPFGKFTADASASAVSEGTPPIGGNRVMPHLPPVVSLTYGAASPHQSLDLDLSLGPASPPNARPGASPAAPVPAVMAPPVPPPLPPLPRMPPMNLPSAPGPVVSPGSRGMVGGPTPIDLAFAQGAVNIGDPFAELAMGGPPPPPPLSRTPTVAQVDPFAVLQPSAPAPQAPPPAFNDPFSVDLGAPPPPATAPSFPPTGPGSLPPGAPPPHDPWVNLIQNQPKREETDPFAGLDALPPPAPSASREPTGEPSRPPSFAGPSTVEVDMSVPRRADASAFRPTNAGANEFELGEATRGHKLDLDYGAGGLELNANLPPPPEPRKERNRETVELGRLSLQQQGQKESEEKPKVVDPKAMARSRFRRELASAMFNVASACIVFYAGIVAIAWLRAPRSIGVDDLGFPMVWLAFGGGGSDPSDLLRAGEIHTGLYPTHAGNELFYVEGTIENASDAARDALYADVEVTRGDHVIAHAEAMAQLAASPEQLWALANHKNDDLQKQLAKDTTSLEVGPHKKAPFIAVFGLTAKDVEGCEVRVTVHPGIPPAMRAAFSQPDPSQGGKQPAPPTQTAETEPKVQ